jgi:hypothetical protein
VNERSGLEEALGLRLGDIPSTHDEDTPTLDLQGDRKKGGHVRTL